MYVTTFYSYKGGVGRTMALVNSGVELTRRGRRVLLVDFDLEAPGLDTFDCLKLSKSSPGIVDFVNEFSETGQAPNIERFVSECPKLGDESGDLLLMPAGISKSTYAENFRGIDWQDLYERRDGYLLFEDLKAQWKEVFRPDYVLIDSRTGHTDVGGICTRQLPDAVAILFFPNEQNLAGLTKVVSDIRSEEKELRAQQIHLHFIMSNVPDLDDEDRILDRKIGAFRKKLGFEGDPLVVHRYDSLSLLNQVVFTKDRPRSRLASEYKQIVEEVVRRNLRDRDGALSYLKRTSRFAYSRSVESTSLKEVDTKLSEIERFHDSDGEVLFRLGVSRQELLEPRLAASLFGRAIEQGYSRFQVHLRRARVLSDMGQAEEASAQALQALESDELSPRSIMWALMHISDDDLHSAVDSRAITSLSTNERIEISHDTYFDTPKLFEAALLILKPIIEDAQLEVESSDHKNQLAVLLIVIGDFNAAAQLLAYQELEDANIESAFNYAVAVWGNRGAADTDAFKAVIQLHERMDASDQYDRANYYQCIALAFAVVGDKEQARDFAKRAEHEVDRHDETFSCWRYRNVSADDFKADIKQMVKQFDDNVVLEPAFLSVDSSQVESFELSAAGS